MHGFQVIDGEAFIDNVPVKLLVERAREQGWCNGPRPEGTMTFQQATLRAAAVQSDETQLVPGRVCDNDDCSEVPPLSPPRFDTQL